MYIACILLIYTLRKKIGSINGKYIVQTFIKTVIASIPMIIVMKVLNNIMHLSYNSTIIVLIKVGISSLAGLFVFVLTAFIINIRELNSLRILIMDKIAKR
jgi:putative peptidoglycan lipid II flippase